MPFQAALNIFAFFLSLLNLILKIGTRRRRRAGLSKNAKRGFQSCGIFFNWSCFKRLSGFIFYHFALEVFSAPQKREIGRELKFGNSCVLPSRANNVLDGSQVRMNFRTLISLAILFD